MRSSVFAVSSTNGFSNNIGHKIHNDGKESEWHSTTISAYCCRPTEVCGPSVILSCIGLITFPRIFLRVGRPLCYEEFVWPMHLKIIGREDLARQVPFPTPSSELNFYFRATRRCVLLKILYKYYKQFHGRCTSTRRHLRAVSGLFEARREKNDGATVHRQRRAKSCYC